VVIHKLLIIIIDPLILYYGGYRYDQPNHLYHMLLICHSMAYFTYDSIIEIYYGTDDLLTNLHHVIVVFSTCFFFFNKYGGFEYIGNRFIHNITVLHLMAEISNPFLILRTLLKIVGMKDSKLYEINDIIFATVFLFVRMLLTPLAMIYMYEGKNVLTAAKFGT
jgi:hypothetical protein